MYHIEPIQALQKEILTLKEEIQETNEGLLALTLDLQHAEENYRSIVERNNDAIVQADEHGVLTYANPSSATIFGFDTTEQLIDQFQTFSNLFDDKEEFSNFHLQLMAGASVSSTALGNKVNRQEIFWLDCHIQPIFDNNKNIIGLEAVMRDITKEKQNYEKMQLASKVLQHSLEGIIVTDKEKQIIFVNPSCTRISGYTQDEVFMQNTSIISSGWHDEKFYEQMWKSIDQIGYWFGEMNDRRKDGSLYAQETTICAIKNNGGEITNYCAIISDISERKKMEDQVKNLAYYDYLTKLPNRFLFKEKLEHALKNAERDQTSLALLFLDLDNFKIINDTHGHYYGDKLLQDVSLRILECIRKNDTIARLGGDEFTIFLEKAEDRNITVSIAEKISNRLNEPYIIDDKLVYTSPSIGIAFYPQDASNYTELLKCADNAMYLSKEKGKNQINFFESALNDKIQEYHKIETQLRSSINNGELTLHYQPVVDLKTQKIQGAEALLRWNNPILGNVPPDVFIHHAEVSGFILEIGIWIIEEACRTIQHFYELGYTDLYISVNVSTKQLREKNFVETILSNLKRYNIKTKNFAIEVTETSLIEYIEDVLPKLQILTEKGISVLLDDFGTGYSSMAYLKKLPTDVVKIDRIFIKDLPEDQDDMQITVTIIAMSHALKKTVTAEGVETQEQLALLIKHGCNKIQGYYFYKPMPFDTFIESIKDQSSIKYKIDEALVFLNKKYI